jgi:hypothetical protein
MAQGGCGSDKVAEWAGHSVAVLMRVYAKFIDGGEQTARARVEKLYEARDLCCEVDTHQAHRAYGILSGCSRPGHLATWPPGNENVQ